VPRSTRGPWQEHGTRIPPTADAPRWEGIRGGDLFTGGRIGHGGIPIPDAYERLLLDAIEGERWLFPYGSAGAALGARPMALVPGPPALEGG
jgi:hypothetical protein